MGVGCARLWWERVLAMVLPLSSRADGRRRGNALLVLTDFD